MRVSTVLATSLAMGFAACSSGGGSASPDTSRDGGTASSGGGNSDGSHASSSGGSGSGGTSGGGTTSSGSSGGDPSGPLGDDASAGDDGGSTDDGSAGAISFATRCAAPGVLVCEGFDTASKFALAVDPGSGVYPAGDNVQRVTFDSSTKASGAGSARFSIIANDTVTGAQVSGYWMQRIGQTFGPGSTFYVQYRFRMDSAMATTNWEDVANGGSSPKISIFHNVQATCASEELTTCNRNATSMAMMYTDCGGRGLFVAPGTTNWNESSPPYEFQNGYYNCEYPTIPHGPGGCFTMPADEWMTSYYRVSLGQWGQPSSVIMMWVATEGQPLEKLIDVENMILNQDGTNEYDTVTLLNYMTDFGQRQAPTNPAANSWYDELIVSTGPIPAPDGPTPQ